MDLSSQVKGMDGAISGGQSDDEDFKSATSEQEDNGDPNVGVAEALRDMGNSNSTGDAAPLNLDNEVEVEDSPKEAAEMKSDGDEAEKSSGPGQLDVISLECQKFLVDIKCAKASQFLSKDVGDLAEMYQEWRRERDPNNQIAVGSARIYLNKWRKRLRDEVEKEGMATVEELGDDVDFVIANPERIARAESDKAKREKAAAASQRLSLSSLSPVKKSEIKYVSLILSEPGTFGLKVENTLSNGVRISDVIPGLQGDKAGFQKGDIVASASMDDSNFEPDKTTLWGKDMAFDDFVKVAQSEKRPIIVRVRRGGPEDEILEKIKQKKTSKKRGRPKKDDSEKKPKKRGRKRTKPTPQALHKFEIRRLRAMREEIIRAHSLRIAADAIDKSMVKTLKDNPMARQKVHETAQIMREESTELWDNPSHGEWEGHLKNLLVFKQMSGHTVVPKTHPDKELLKFLTYMRTTKKSLGKGEFKKTKRKEKAKIEVEIFDKIGFMWKPTTKAKGWLESFKELEEYKDKHGTCMIPKQKKGSENRNLFLWVNLQRRKYETKSLPDIQIKRLSDLGMVWNLKDQKSWDDHLEDLLEYKLKNGNCKVPAIYKPNRLLGKWVDKMRQEKEFREQGETSDILTDERIKMLDYFGFAWEMSRHTPRKRAASDSEDEAEDEDYESDEQKMVVRPRKKNKVGRPSLGRSWEEYYEDLVDFERQQGHCKVPQNYPVNRPLGSWVNRMRQQKKKDEDEPSDILTVERLRKLNEIGFLWSARDSRGRRSTVPKDDDGSDTSWADDDGVKASWPKRGALKHDLFAKVSGKDLSNHGLKTEPASTSDGAGVNEVIPKDIGFLYAEEKGDEGAEETKADGGPAPKEPKQEPDDETKGGVDNLKIDNKGAEDKGDGGIAEMDINDEPAQKEPEQDGTADEAAEVETEKKPDDENKDDDKALSEVSAEAKAAPQDQKSDELKLEA